MKGILVSNGSYPLLLARETSSKIYIEVYSVSEKIITELDNLEEPYDLYRKKVKISELDALVDTYIGPHKEIPTNFRLVTNENFIATKPFKDKISRT